MFSRSQVILDVKTVILMPWDELRACLTRTLYYRAVAKWPISSVIWMA